jgi:hypothetical protein
MRRQVDMILALDRRLGPVTGVPIPPETLGGNPGLNIFVVFTSTVSTIAALKKAGGLAENLGAKVTMIVPQIVPYPLPLTSPPVLLDFQEKRFSEIAAQSPVETRVQIYLCRDDIELLERVLKPHSLVVIGGRRKWWPTKETRLARKMQGQHEVIFTETG